MASQETDQQLKLEQLGKLVFEMARDLKYLLDNRASQFARESQLPTDTQRADEIQTTLAETQKLFGVALQTRDGETA